MITHLRDRAAEPGERRVPPGAGSDVAVVIIARNRTAEPAGTLRHTTADLDVRRVVVGRVVVRRVVVRRVVVGRAFDLVAAPVASRATGDLLLGAAAWSYGETARLRSHAG